MQLGLKLTDETLLCDEHLARQSSVDDFSVGCIQGVDGRAELSWIVCGTLQESSATSPETTGQERASGRLLAREGMERSPQ